MICRVGNCKQCGCCCQHSTTWLGYSKLFTPMHSLSHIRMDEHCKKYDAINKRCKVHDNQPQICRVFPQSPEQQIICAEDCGYRFIEVYENDL